MRHRANRVWAGGCRRESSACTELSPVSAVGSLRREAIDFTETDDQRYGLSYQGNCCPLALQARGWVRGIRTAYSYQHELTDSGVVAAPQRGKVMPHVHVEGLRFSSVEYYGSKKKKGTQHYCSESASFAIQSALSQVTLSTRVQFPLFPHLFPRIKPSNVLCALSRVTLDTSAQLLCYHICFPGKESSSLLMSMGGRCFRAHPDPYRIVIVQYFFSCLNSV